MIIKKINIQPIEQEIEFILAKNQKIILMPLGDIHYAPDAEFPARKLRQHIEWGLKRGAWFLGMGEYLDFTSASQRKLLHPLRDHQKAIIDGFVLKMVQDIYEILEPSKGRWIGMLEGDHRWEFSSLDLSGRSADQYLCELLECDFLGTSTFLRLHAKDNLRGHPEADCLVYAHHGIGSSRTQGGHLHRVEDLLKWVNADIYLMGHSHGKVTAPIDRQEISPDGVHYHRTKLIARTGAWLLGYRSKKPQLLTMPAGKSRGTYQEEKAYTPSALGGLCIGIGYEQVKGSRYYRPTIHYSV